MAKENKSLKGVLIEDLEEVQVNVKDALLLADHGIVVPEQSLFYEDADITYDPDFDEVEWQKEPLRLSWEEKAKLFEETLPDADVHGDKITLDIMIKDKEAREWARKNYKKVSETLGSLIEGLYKTYKIIK